MKALPVNLLSGAGGKGAGFVLLVLAAVVYMAVKSPGKSLTT